MSEPITNVEDAVRELGALPMPAGSDRAKAPWGRAEDGRPFLPMGAHWTDVPELVDRTVARIQARVDEAQSGHWYRSPISDDRPGTVHTRVNGYPRTVGQFTNVSSADLELVLHAGSDLRWCLEMIAKFRARVAELEAERHTTNDALADVTLAQRAAEDRPVDEDPIGYALTEKAEASADKLTQLLAPTQALREDDDPARCLEAHPFSPRDGWRLICGSCDHSERARCHRVESGGAS